MNKIYRHERSEGYVVLLTVLILVVVISTITSYLLLTGQNASISSNSVRGGVEAKSGANGCIQLALAAIQANTSLSTPNNGSQTLDSTIPETCTYAITGTSPNYSILAVGTVSQNGVNYIHRISVTLSAVTPQLVISSWQDTQ